MRAFQKNGNDFYIDRKGLDIKHPSSLAFIKSSIYFPANIVEENIPHGEIKSQNSDEYLNGFDQIAVVTDIDTPPHGFISVILSVDKGVIVLSPENTDMSRNPSNGNNNDDNNGHEKTEKKKLRFLISGPESYGKEIQFLFNSLYSSGHSVFTTNSTQETVIRSTDHFTDLISENSDRKFDCLLVSIFFPGDIGGLQITRNIRDLETVKNITSTPIFVFSKVFTNSSFLLIICVFVLLTVFPI